MATDEDKIFEKLGGQKGLNIAVPIFFKKVLADPLVGPVFSALDVDRQCRKMLKFMTFAFGGAKEYTGRSMKQVHTGLNIQED